VDDDVTSDNLERHQGRFEDEEVVAGSDAEGFVDVASREPDKGRGDGQVRDHFRHT